MNGTSVGWEALMCVFSTDEVKEVGPNVNVLLSPQCSSYITSSSGVIFPPVCCVQLHVLHTYTIKIRDAIMDGDILISIYPPKKDIFRKLQRNVTQKNWEWKFILFYFFFCTVRIAV